MEPLTPTPASEWAGAIQVAGTDLRLPSDNVARVRQLSPTAFLTEGLIPDPLSGIIRQAIHTKKGLNPAKLRKVMEEPNQLQAALKMFDTVLSYVMVEPVIKMPPPCDVEVEDAECGLYADEDIHKNPTESGHHEYHEGERLPGVLYADMVSMDDKMFIFQWALGGTRDLQKFRGELDGSVESLSDGKGKRKQAKQPAGRN